jgi:TPR repeat protein
MAPSESASSPAASETEATPDPAKPTPAKPVRSAITKPAPAPAPVSGDDQLVADGEKYLYGNGVPANCDRAQKNLRAAAGHGSSRALSMLGTMYATGHCADRDLPNAYRSFAKALHLDPNNSRIQSDLEILWRQMTPDERQAATHSN